MPDHVRKREEIILQGIRHLENRDVDLRGGAWHKFDWDYYSDLGEQDRKVEEERNRLVEWAIREQEMARAEAEKKQHQVHEQHEQMLEALQTEEKYQEYVQEQLDEAQLQEIEYLIALYEAPPLFPSRNDRRGGGGGGGAKSQGKGKGREEARNPKGAPKGKGKGNKGPQDGSAELTPSNQGHYARILATLRETHYVTAEARHTLVKALAENHKHICDKTGEKDDDALKQSILNYLKGKNVEIGRLEMQENRSGRDRPKGKGKGRETNEETFKQKRRQQGQSEPGPKDRTQYQDSWEKVKIDGNKTDWKITGRDGEGKHTEHILKQIPVKETQRLQEGPPRLVLTTREHVVSTLQLYDQKHYIVTPGHQRTNDPTINIEGTTIRRQNLMLIEQDTDRPIRVTVYSTSAQQPIKHTPIATAKLTTTKDAELLVEIYRDHEYKVNPMTWKKCADDMAPEHGLDKTYSSPKSFIIFGQQKRRSPPN